MCRDKTIPFSRRKKIIGPVSSEDDKQIEIRDYVSIGSKFFIKAYTDSLESLVHFRRYHALRNICRSLNIGLCVNKNLTSHRNGVSNFNFLIKELFCTSEGTYLE